jgi:hypothetical protein
MENAALSIFEMREGTWRVMALNDTSHLSTPQAEISHQ